MTALSYRTHVQSGVPCTCQASASVPAVLDTGVLAKMEGSSNIGIMVKTKSSCGNISGNGRGVKENGYNTIV